MKKQKKRVITKILNFDENNQYGHGMTKPLPTGCIKGSNDIFWETFNVLLESVNFDDKIGHLYIVDMNLILKIQLKKNLLTMKFIHP